MLDTKTKFDKSFTQQESIPEAAIERVVDILKSGRLHRYNVAPGETSEAALLEHEYAAYQGSKYCIACASGGYGLHVALRSAGLKYGDKVLANAWTLAPVPGAIHNAGGKPVFVEISDDWCIDVEDLANKADETGAKFLMLSHMRGHIGDMDAIMKVCDDREIKVIEDCAHTMGARWKGKQSGNFGHVAAFSAQTYKHINSGEGGFITTDDPEVAARATVHSGSYMLYERHGAGPSNEFFENIKLDTPNYSGRIDNIRAAILRAQLPLLDNNIKRWNERYSIFEQELKNIPEIKIVLRPQHEEFVGSSFQFHLLDKTGNEITHFIERCSERGVEIKWFGGEKPNGFTSRYDSWRYLGGMDELPKTLRILSTTCDIRVPLTFDLNDCKTIAQIIAQEAQG